ncbi:DUF6230 family protein [Streptomyces mirabilis]|uniref:DUF6230 family protein n=1 Tax=Streptomyces mirabilis TaxID=68239 RepID=UPI0036764EFA
MMSTLTASVGLFVALAQGALAASFLISGQEFKVSAERIEGTGVIQYGAFDRQYDGKNIPVVVTGYKKLTTIGLCQSVVARDIPLVGTVTVKTTARRSTARDAYSDVVQTDDATVTIKNSRNGIAAGASRKEPGINDGDNTSPASVAQDADSIVVTNSRAIVVATSATIITNEGSSLRIYKGIKECF